MSPLRFFVEHEKDRITICYASAGGITFAKVTVQGVSQESVAAGTEMLRKEVERLIGKAFTTPYIPSTGLVGPRPYRTPEVAKEEEQQARSGVWEVPNG